MVLVSSRNCAFIFCSSIHMGGLSGTIIWLPVTTSKFRPKMDYRRFRKEKFYLFVSYILQLKRRAGNSQPHLPTWLLIYRLCKAYHLPYSARSLPHFGFKSGRWPNQENPSITYCLDSPCLRNII